MKSPCSPVKPGSATNNLSADTFETPEDPNVLIYSNAINMAGERLGNTLTMQTVPPWEMLCILCVV